MGVGVADEATFGRVSEQRLDDREGDQPGIGELWGDADSGSFVLPVRMILQQVIDSDVQSCCESVQVSVSCRFLQDQAWIQRRSWTLSRSQWGIIARTARNPWSQTSRRATLPHSLGPNACLVTP